MRGLDLMLWGIVIVFGGGALLLGISLVYEVIRYRRAMRGTEE